MRYSVGYQRAAAAEVEDAISWYAQPEINQTPAFIQDLQLTESHLRTHPAFYPRVEGDVRRAFRSVFHPFLEGLAANQDQIEDAEPGMAEDRAASG